MRTPASSGVEGSDHVTAALTARAPNLQDAFAAFVRAREEKSRAEKGSSGSSKTKSHSKPASTLAAAAHRDERRARLRALFVETARGFIGVPYARKHHDPHYCTCEGCSTSGRQLYHAPLFLDCCGLVRRVARALEGQLGFRLGPGNQAYQYDTLPVRLASASQLQPGDLIFYSGTYTQPGSRRHAFDMTHVEIFVGGTSREATLGSRERYKWVMQYDSYRFKSQRWKLLAHHFCSIDPWLDGVCVPQNPDLWRPRRRGSGCGHGTNDSKKEQQQEQGSTSSQGAWVTPARTAHGTTWNADRYSIFGSRAADADRGAWLRVGGRVGERS